MQWTKIESGQTNRAFQRFMVSLGDIADTVVTKINTDEAYVNRLAVICHNNGFEPSTSQARAREIMGTNIFGVEEAIKHYGVNPPRRQLAYMAEIPYSDELLLQCKDTHILSAVFRMSIVAVRAKTAQVKLPEGQQSLFNQQSLLNQDWYCTHSFANNAGQLEWYLVRKTPAPGSAFKTWDKQQDLLKKEIEETPTAQVMVYTMIGHFLNTGERLFEEVWLRCSDLDSFNYRVEIRFYTEGLYIGSNSDGGVNNFIAVASSRKRLEF